MYVVQEATKMRERKKIRFGCSGSQISFGVFSQKFIIHTHLFNPSHHTHPLLFFYLIEVKAAAEKLGYTKKIWDADKEPDACDEYWKDLTAEQQAAAKVLGYTAATWDAED